MMNKQKLIFIFLLFFARSILAADKSHLDVTLTASDDNNIARAMQATDIFRDTKLTLGASYLNAWMLNDKSALLGQIHMDVEQFARFDALSNIALGFESTYRVQPILGYSTPVFDLTLGADRLQYRNSDIRDGYEMRAAFRATSRLTDRIKIKLSAELEKRTADEAEVFDWVHQTLSAALDYRINKNTFYLNYAKTNGDQVFTSSPDLGVKAISKAIEVDSVFGARRAYRLDAETDQWSLAYQLSVNAKNSLDITFQTIDSTAERNANYRYHDRLLSVGWIYRFF